MKEISLPTGWTHADIDDRCTKIWDHVRDHAQSLSAEVHTKAIANLVIDIVEEERTDQRKERAANEQRFTRQKTKIKQLKEQLTDCKKKNTALKRDLKREEKFSNTRQDMLVSFNESNNFFIWFILESCQTGVRLEKQPSTSMTDRPLYGVQDCKPLPNRPESCWIVKDGIDGSELARGVSMTKAIEEFKKGSKKHGH